MSAAADGASGGNGLKPTNFPSTVLHDHYGEGVFGHGLKSAFSTDTSAFSACSSPKLQELEFKNAKTSAKDITRRRSRINYEICGLGASYEHSTSRSDPALTHGSILCYPGTL